jgi:hypothetical protein
MSDLSQPLTGGAITSAEVILAVGHALYGRNWQSELADALVVSPRTLRRWINGECELRHWVWEELWELMESRRLTDLRPAVLARALTALL